MSKPENTLTQLEEEPETGFFGCTYTEISSALKRGLIVAIVACLLLIVVIRWEVSAIIGIAIGAVYFYILVKGFSKNRADKPLYYHKHLAIYKTADFIQPSSYQRERN